MDDRRTFLRRAATVVAAGRLAMSPAFGAADALQREPREVGAIGRATEWLNSPRLTPASLAGKIVLVDFCTYTCINWLRTLPYIRGWEKKYRQGLVVIGVHTAEFPFEHNLENVRRAIQAMRIEWPIVIDNDYGIWRAFRNQYWPALYFVDARGEVRDHQFGEGEYDRSEKIIQRLLAAAGSSGSNSGAVPFESGGQPPGPAHGLDADGDGNGSLVEPRLHQLIRQPTPVGDRTFEIEFMESGVEAFAFTFG